MKNATRNFTNRIITNFAAWKAWRLRRSVLNNCVPNTSKKKNVVFFEHYKKRTITPEFWIMHYFVEIPLDLKHRWKGETSRIPSISIGLSNIPGFVPQTDRFSFRNDFYLQWNGLGNLNSHQVENMRSISSVWENHQEPPNDTFKSENVLLSVHKPSWHKIHVFSLISSRVKCFSFFLFKTSIRD